MRLLPAFLLAMLLLTGCERRESPVTVESELAGNGADQESWGTDLSISDAGRPRLRLRAAYMAYYEREDSTYMLLSGLDVGRGDRVRALIFDSDGDSSATVLADRILYFDRDRKLEARGNVMVTTRSGKQLESEHLNWSEVDHSIRTPGFARITTPDQRIQGYGLEADEDLADFRLSNVTGVVRFEDQ